MGLMTIFKFVVVKSYVSEHGAFSLSLERRNLPLRSSKGVLSGLKCLIITSVLYRMERNLRISCY